MTAGTRARSTAPELGRTSGGELGEAPGVARWRRPVRGVRALVVVAAVLVVVGPAVRIAVNSVQDDPALPQSWLAEAARLVDLDAEANLPSWFSGAVLAAVGVCLLVAALVGRARGARAWPLLVPAAVGAYLSVDEVAELHEQLALVADLLGAGGGLEFVWVVPGAVLALVVGLVLVAAARHMAPWLRWRLVAAGAVYLTGALVVETLTSGLDVEGPGGAALPAGQPVGYVLLNAVEEGLEMAGALLALWAVASLLRVAVTPGGLVADLDPGRPALRSR